MISLTYSHLELQLNHPFKIADFSRTYTPVILVELRYEGIVGYGEASMPPYLGENFQTADSFLNQVNLQKFNPNQIEELLEYVDEIATGNNATKAAIDIAIHDLWAKINNQPLFEMIGSDPSQMPFSSFTLGIDTVDKLLVKVKEAHPFNILKIKLGSHDDKSIITALRTVSDKAIYVDANRGWKTKEHALEMIEWLSQQNCLLVEQPLEINQIVEMEWLKDKSPIPLIADESCRRLFDIEKIENAFHGINIKLMKSTGIKEARKMITEARKKNLKIMIGCMSETSCGIAAAAALAPQADYCDLDSPWMVSNNPFENPTLTNGKIVLSKANGLGLLKRQSA